MTDETSRPTVSTPNDGSPSSPPDNSPDSTSGRPAQQDARTTEIQDPLRGSRASGIWVGVVVLGIVLVLLIVFISQNTQEVSVTFFGWQGRAPLSVALLAAAAGGLFLTASAGSLRILQLRRRVRHNKKQAKKG